MKREISGKKGEDRGRQGKKETARPLEGKETRPARALKAEKEDQLHVKKKKASAFPLENGRRSGVK